MERITAKRIGYGIRPPRVAVFVHIKDRQWKRHMINIMHVLPTLWGGDGYILIPTDGETIHPVFETLMLEYDPDYLIAYSLTGKDMEVSDPKKFEGIAKQYADKWSSETEISFEDALKAAKRQLADNPLNNQLKIDPSKDLSDRLSRIFPVFERHGRPISSAIGYKPPQAYQLPKLVDILPNLKDKITMGYSEVDLSAHDLDTQLLGYSLFGGHEILKQSLDEKIKSIESDIKTAIKKAPHLVPLKKAEHQTLLRIASSKKYTYKKSNTAELLETVFTREADPSNRSFYSLFVAGNGSADSVADTNHLAIAPFSLSKVGLSSYYKMKDHQGPDSSVPIVVTGGAMVDFCLYYTLSKMRTGVYWLAPQRLRVKSRGYLDQLADHLRSALRDADDKNHLYITSVSTPPSKIGAAQTMLKDKVTGLGTSSPGQKVEYINLNKSYLRKLLPYQYRLFESGYGNTSKTYQLVDGKGLGNLELDLPHSYTPTNPMQHNWMYEMRTEGYAPPALPLDYTSQVINTGKKEFMQSARVSKLGMSMSAISNGFISSSNSIDDLLQKPVLNTPPALDIFQSVFSPKYDVRPSDKGNYTYQAQAVVGYDALKEYSADPLAMSIFDKFIDDKDNGQGFLARGRRYLAHENFASIFARSKGLDITIPKGGFPDKASEEEHKKNVKASDNGGANVVNKLVGANILKAGFVLKCDRCLNADWYEFRDLSYSFECSRCSNLVPVQGIALRAQKQHARHLVMYYKLNELFYQYWKHHNYLDVLTARHFEKNNAVIASPQIEFRIDRRTEKPIFEIDLCMSVDGSTYLGETKMNANHPDDKQKLSLKHVKNLLLLANYQPVTAFVFVSWNNKWPSDVMQYIEKLREETNLEIYTLSKQDLLAP